MNENVSTAFWKIQYDPQSRAIVITIRGSLQLELAQQIASETLTAAVTHKTHNFLADSRKLDFSLSSGFDALSLPYLLLANAPKSHRHIAITHRPSREAPHIFHFVEGMYRQAGYSVRFFTNFADARAWLIARRVFAIKRGICRLPANNFMLNRVSTRQLWCFENKNNPQHTR